MLVAWPRKRRTPEVQQGRGQPRLWGLWPIGCVFTGKCLSLLELGSLIYRVWMSLPPVGPFFVT